MSTEPRPDGKGLKEIKVEYVSKPRRHTHGSTGTYEPEQRGTAKVPSRSTGYVNSAYTGSLNSVAGNSENRLPEPPTGVIREQYWACSRWPYGQKVLALAVGVLLGALIGLSVSYALKDADDVIGGIFRAQSD